MTAAATRFATEKTGFSPVLMQLFILREFLRGITMKTRSKVFNLKALQNHLLLTRKQSMHLDGYASCIDMKKTSIIMQIYSDGSCYCDTTSDPIASKESGSVTAKEMHGVYAVHYLTPDADVGPSVTAPFCLVERGMPDKGHAVYIVNMFSVDRLRAIKNIGNGMIPMPLESQKTDDGEKTLFDVATHGSVPVYIGKTSKGVGFRLKQHMYSAYSGSTTKFHKVLCGSNKYQPMIPATNLLGLYQSEQEAYDAESKVISSTVGLPGVYLCNILGATMALDDLLKFAPKLRGKIDAEYAEERLMELRSRASDNWDDPEYAEDVICNNDKNFDAHEVRLIRMLSRMGDSDRVISIKIGSPVNRIKTLLSGNTYSRIL